MSALAKASQGMSQSSFLSCVLRLIGACTVEHNGPLAFLQTDSCDTPPPHTHNGMCSLDEREWMIGEGGVVCARV